MNISGHVSPLKMPTGELVLKLREVGGKLAAEAADQLEQFDRVAHMFWHAHKFPEGSEQNRSALARACKAHADLAGIAKPKAAPVVVAKPRGRK